jgi:GTPase SAR1 family protein
VLDQGLVVIYGPGGIGKTHFLGRLAGRYTRRSLNDLTQGIPIFTILPTLLHRDVLENYLAYKDNSFRGLTLYQIRALIQHGIVIPFLDAFDELARGTVREGCKEFLKSLNTSMRQGAVGILTSRDYYLHIDPLIPQALEESRVSQLVMGFFNRQGRKDFIRKTTKISEPAVNAWSASLENQVATIFASLNERETNGLVGHPLFMDALCYFITSIPRDEVTRAANSFRFQKPNVFGDIVEKILEREYEKAKEGWGRQLGGKLLGDWTSAPFSVSKQLDVLKHLTLKIAEIGGINLSRDRLTVPGIGLL